MEHITLITAIAGLAFGFLGAVLGVINTCRAISRDRIKIGVLPVWIFSQHGIEGMGIEITNLSFMPVTVSHVGFTVRGSDEHMPILDGVFGGGRFPQRMEPRTQITAFVSAAAYEHSNFARVHKAYVDTACGKRFTGTSKTLRGQIRKMASTPS
jgi:hypothetical protein